MGNLKVRWRASADEHDYPAAYDYLTLLMPEEDAAYVIEGLRNTPITHRKAKDILRASGLALLPKSNSHVAADLKRIQRGEKLSPILLVRRRRLIVADGYHRVCAAWYAAEDTDIPCKLV